MSLKPWEETRKVSLQRGDVLVYKGLDIDRDVLEAIVSVDKRLLWAFVRGENGDVRAIPYSEEHCIWLSKEDVVRPEEVEL